MPLDFVPRIHQRIYLLIIPTMINPPPSPFVARVSKKLNRIFNSSSVSSSTFCQIDSHDVQILLYSHPTTQSTHRTIPNSRTIILLPPYGTAIEEIPQRVCSTG